jgi:LacI family transcriptional regulator
MKELVRMGYKIPKDISITGFYDTPWCEVITPELTTTKIDIEQMAKLAVSEVLKESPGRTICKIQPKLVVRNSVCTL